MAIAFSRGRAFGRGNAGSTAVEFAIAAPLLFVLMFGIIEFGRAWWIKNSLEYAVQRAARWDIINNNDAGVPAYAVTQVYGQTVASTTFPPPTHPDGGTTCVSYSYNYSPWFVGVYKAMSGITTMTGISCRTHY